MAQDIKPDSPEWHLQHLDVEMEYWQILLKDTPDESGRRTFIKNKIRQIEYRIEGFKQLSNEKESDALREWLKK